MVGLVVDDTMLLLPPGLEMELEVWGLQDKDEARAEVEVAMPVEPSPGVILACCKTPWNPGDFNLGLPVEPHWLSSRARLHTGYIFPGLPLWPPC